MKEYLAKEEKALFYRLTANVQEASAEECAEIISEIEEMSDQEQENSSVKRFTI